MSLTRWHHTVAALVLVAAFWLVVARRRVNAIAVADGGGREQRRRSLAARPGSTSAVRCATWDASSRTTPMSRWVPGWMVCSRMRHRIGRSWFESMIQRGSLRMPGFRYNFTPAEFEELMAYLKTL